MEANGYAYQLRQLREMERRRSKDFTEQAVAVFNSRQASIDAMDVPPEQKSLLVQRALRQYETFMGRPYPAQG